MSWHLPCHKEKNPKFSWPCQWGKYQNFRHIRSEIHVKYKGIFRNRMFFVTPNRFYFLQNCVIGSKQRWCIEIHLRQQNVKTEIDTPTEYTCCIERMHGPLARYMYVKLLVEHAPGMPGAFSRATAGWRSRHASQHVLGARAVMHAGIASNRFPFNSVEGETFPAFPVHGQPTILRIWQEARDLSRTTKLCRHFCDLSVSTSIYIMGFRCMKPISN